MTPSMQILIVDDEPAIRQVLAAFLERAGYAVDQVSNGEAAVVKMAKGEVDVAICDISMPGISGIDVVRRVRAAGIDTTFIMITAFASVDTAIEAMKAGATDYIIKPLRNEEVLQRLKQIAILRGMRDENRVLRSLVMGEKHESYLFEAPQMRETERLISKVAPTDSTVLITGESGTGKGIVARSIHRQSHRADAPFIPVNCGAIPENLVESEFFGHTKGAFTGADKARKGLLQQADKGTIFLDEIGELPLQLQAKLLHVIEDKEVRPLGSEQVRRVDIRIVAATNRNLSEMVARGEFREDLYFRLSVFHVHVPPLREMRQDIPGLLDFMLQRCAKGFEPGRKISLDPAAEEVLQGYDWPGNVRELENVIERACILVEGDRVTLEDLPPEITKIAPGSAAGGSSRESGTLRDMLRRFEFSAISQAIEAAGGDRRLAAQSLGIGLSSLYRKLEEYGGSGGANESNP